MVTAAQRRRAVQEAMIAAALPERRACRYTGFARSSQRYCPRREDQALAARLATLAELKPRWGYRRLHWLLVRDGWRVNRKRVQRVYRAAGLAVRRRRRKRVSTVRVARPQPQTPIIRWSMDFVHDTLGDGRAIRIFTVVDDFTRACVLLVADVTLGAPRVTRELGRVGQVHGLPRTLVCDNGPEFTSQAFDQWAHTRGVALQFIRPGHPVENAYIESFNGRLRDECLNQSWFASLADAQQTLAAWQAEYNGERPHSALAGRTPNEFVRDFEQRRQGTFTPDRYE